LISDSCFVFESEKEASMLSPDPFRVSDDCRAVRIVVAVILVLQILGSPGSAQQLLVEDEPDPAVVANFYFGGTFMTGNEWFEGPWGSPALIESLNHYAAHQNGTPNSKGQSTWHFYLPGVGAWYSGVPEFDVPYVHLASKLYGDIPHCTINPWGWHEIFYGSDTVPGGKLGALE
jgi:hypothetical protein